MKRLEFPKLAEQYAPLIAKVIRSLHLYRDFDDYYQIALLALWEAYKKFDATKGSFTAYAYTTIRGHLLNELAKQKRIAEHTASLTEQVESYHDVYPCEFTELIASVTPLQQRILSLRFIDGMTFQHIATHCQLTPDVVKYQYKRAITALRHQEKAATAKQ